MPQLIFPASQNGLFIDAVVGLDGATTTALLAAGQPIPAPVLGRGAIDTGSDVTAVSTSILTRFGLQAKKQAITQTIAGPLSVSLFKVSVGITDFAIPNAQQMVEPTLLVMELASPLPNLDALVGLDMLMTCRFLLDGPGKTFTLDF